MVVNLRPHSFALIYQVNSIKPFIKARTSRWWDPCLQHRWGTGSSRKPSGEGEGIMRMQRFLCFVMVKSIKFTDIICLSSASEIFDGRLNY